MNDTDATLVAAYARSWTRPDRARLPALVAEDATLDYAALHERVARAAGALRAAGVAAGDFVAVAMERSLEQLIAILGAMAARLPVSAGTPVGRRGDGASRCRRGPAGCCTTLRTRGRPRPGCRPSACCPPRAWRGASLLGAGAGAGRAGAAALHPGSTGHPKGVLLSHRGLMNNAHGVLAHSGLTPDDRLLHVMPLHHTNALNNRSSRRCWPGLRGAGRALPRRGHAGAAGALAPHHHDRRADHVRAHAGPGIRTRQPGGLRYARCGSAPITEALHRRIEAFLGCPLLVSLRPVGGDLHLDHESARAAWARWARCWPASVVLRQPDGSAAPAGGEVRSASRATA